jgi:hypothetical protein
VCRLQLELSALLRSLLVTELFEAPRLDLDLPQAIIQLNGIFNIADLNVHRPEVIVGDNEQRLPPFPFLEVGSSATVGARLWYAAPGHVVGGSTIRPGDARPECFKEKGEVGDNWLYSPCTHRWRWWPTARGWSWSWRGCS